MIIEDTFILLDAFEEDAELLRELKPIVCLEMGYVLVCGDLHMRLRNFVYLSAFEVQVPGSYHHSLAGRYLVLLLVASI